VYFGLLDDEVAQARDLLAAIEAAARRDAVREALVRTEAVPEDAPGIGSGKAAVWYERGWLDRADAIFAALAAMESNHQSITATDAEMARAAMAHAREEYES
jgi:hypothetical protein